MPHPSILNSYPHCHLKELEAESISILREVTAEFKNPVLLYSVGKDSSVMLHLAQKAFFPEKIPFPLLHIDTTYKFSEMYEFRDRRARELGVRLVVSTNNEAIKNGANPFALGMQKCCGLLKTQALLDALNTGEHDAAIGGARRDEEKSRAKERIYSFRDGSGHWHLENQRPELWSLVNTQHHPGETFRIFPLSNWTELDIWTYIFFEDIPVVPLYFAKERDMLVRGNQLILFDDHSRFFSGPLLPGEKPEKIICRFRSLGCASCSGAIRSTADSISKIIEELLQTRYSERALRLIDHDRESSMEVKKREGYF